MLILMIILSIFHTNCAKECGERRHQLGGTFLFKPRHNKSIDPSHILLSIHTVIL